MQYLLVILIFLAPALSSANVEKLYRMQALSQVLRFNEILVNERMDRIVLIKETKEIEKKYDHSFFQKGDFVFHAEKTPLGKRMIIFSGFTIEEARASHVEFYSKTRVPEKIFSSFFSFILPSAHAGDQDYCEIDPNPNRPGFIEQLLKAFQRDIDGFAVHFKCLDQALISAIRSIIEDIGGLAQLAMPWKYDDFLREVRDTIRRFGEIMKAAGDELSLFFHGYQDMPFEERFPILCAAMGQFIPDVLLGKVAVSTFIKADRFSSFLRSLRARFPGKFRAPAAPLLANGPLFATKLREWSERMMRVMPDQLFTTAKRIEYRSYFRKWENPEYARSTKVLDLTEFSTIRELDRHLLGRGFKKVSSCMYYPECGPNPIQIDFYLHHDGGVVKVKPNGDPKSTFRPEPHASKIIMRRDVYGRIPHRFSSDDAMKKFAHQHLGFKDEMIKVSNDGRTLLPKDKSEAANPYPDKSPHAERLNGILMNEVHWNMENNVTSYWQFSEQAAMTA